MNKKLAFVMTALSCSLFHTPIAAAPQTKRATQVEQSRIQTKPTEPAAVARKQALTSLSEQNRTLILTDLDRLIQVDPVSTLSVDEFHNLVEIQQWAIGQQKRIHFVDVLTNRKQQLLSQNASLKNAKNTNVEIALIDAKLNSLGEDAQLANVDLQNRIQKMQQTTQTISNISKMMHDTAMGVIRKID